MNRTTSTASAHYSDGLDAPTLTIIEQQVSGEIAATTDATSALLDGTALERRNRRIAARALAGITTKYGVALGQAVRESEDQASPVTIKHTGRKTRRAAVQSVLGQVA